jgi:hypothetical protein
MKAIHILILGTALAAPGFPLPAGEQAASPGDAQGQQDVAPSPQEGGGEAAKEAQPKAEPPPLPFHTIEGYGGGAITPMAYLVNPSTTSGRFFGLPAFAMTYAGIGSKSLVAMTVTETLVGRIEIGYGADQLTLGTLPEDIEEASTVDIEEDHVWLHNINVRGLVLEENSFDLPLPAFTVGAHFKYNDGVEGINDSLGRALEAIGFDSASGAAFTATLTKMFPNVLGRPLFLTAGMRVSHGAQLGFLGFSNKWSPTFEANVVFLPLDWLILGYEFRQRENPYDTIPGLVNDEDDWHAFEVGVMIGNYGTLVGGYCLFGRMVNERVDDGFALQLKVEF